MKVFCGTNWFTRDWRPRWLLRELELPYERVDIDLFAGEGRKPDYLDINPTGKVPFLVDGQVRIFESGAIVVFLADRYGIPRLAPELDDPARGPYLQWIFFTQLNLETPATRVFANRTFLARRDSAASRAAEAQAELETHGRLLENHLASREFLLGDRFSAADIVLATTLTWADRGKGLENLPVLAAYLERLRQRPCFRWTFEEKEPVGLSG